MTMKFYYPRPWFIKVKGPATEFTANSVLEGALFLPETGAILQCLLAILLDHSNFMKKMPMSNPIKWSCDYSRAWLTMVNVPARSDGAGAIATESEAASVEAAVDAAEQKVEVAAEEAKEISEERADEMVKEAE